jgi:colanic acid/amylovoran biosynthesis glycosyltransferase
MKVAAPEKRVAYLTSIHPAISQSFIVREIWKLREMNFEIQVASINPHGRSSDELASDEVEEASSTYYVKNAGMFAIFSAHLVTLATQPAAYLRALFYSLRLGDTSIRKIALSLAYFLEAVMVGRWMASKRLRHLHVHLANPACTVGLIASRMFPIGFSFTVHGPDEFYDVPGYRLKEKIAGASFVCCIGYFARSQLMKLSPPEQWDKFEVAPLGVDPEVFVPSPFAGSTDRFEILCVGRLVSSKGQHVLISAVEELVHAEQKICLRFVGSGPDEESLKRDVAERGLGREVVFEGSVNQDRIREFYRQADVFVLPSFAEGIPVALMEAMAMEIPCISTFVAGIPELIRDDIDGILVAPSDEHALAVAIERLIVNPELRCRLGRAGRCRVIEKYNLESNVARLAMIFTSRIRLPNVRHDAESFVAPGDATVQVTTTDGGF